MKRSARRPASRWTCLWVACGVLWHDARATVNPVFADGFEEFTCSAGDNPQPNTGIAAEPGSAGCPDGMVAVDAFCIDRYEAALIDDSPDAGGAAWSPYFNPAGTSVHAVSAQAAVPQGYISQIQAGAACTAAGKRLCSDGEWLRACQGPATALYPYGDTRIDGACNDTRSVDPVVEYFGAATDFSFAQVTHPCLNQLRNGLDRAGANPACVSAEGVYDLVGNLDEWTAGTTVFGHGVFRGGDYVDSTLNGAGCTYTTTAHEPTFYDYSTGFRCCADPVATPLVIRLPK